MRDRRSFGSRQAAALAVLASGVLLASCGAKASSLPVVGVALLVTAVALFLSTFSSPFLSAALTFGLWVIGHFNTDLRNFEAVVESKAAAYVARGLYYILPNFAAFDIKTQVVHALPVEASYVATTALYGAVYIGFLLTGAVAVFSRRDFK